jgi:hypothetical protein
MGLITTPALAAAVSNAGGLGGIGMWGLTAEEVARRVAGFRQLSPGSLNVNYPLWPEPRYTAEASEAMRHHLQIHYDAKGLGPVPQPQGVASDVSPEHVAMLDPRPAPTTSLSPVCPASTAHWGSSERAAPRNPGIEQPALLQILDEKRKLAKRGHRCPLARLPLHVNSARKRVGDHRPLLAVLY